MALSDRVTERFSAQFMVSITNPDDQDAASINTTLLGYAATDVEADFKVYAGIEYDETEDTHVSVAVQGVILKLQNRRSQGEPRSDDNWIERLKALAMVTARDRISPVTDSILSPSDRSDETTPIRPIFDPDNFEDITPTTP